MSFNVKKNNKIVCLLLSAMTTVLFASASSVCTAVAAPDVTASTAVERLALPVQSNETEDWPAGPKISAESAILIDADSHAILYAKNIHEQLYPASTTKLLTCLIAAENGNLDDTVTFSHTAVSSVPSDGSNMGIDEGQSLPLEKCLYGIMVGSANEAANAVAEYISGSIPEFATLMNKKAAELGCQDSHFANANGIHEDDHYTSAYDLSLIGAAFFHNDALAKIGNTPQYHFTPTEGQPDDFYLKNKHKLITGEIPCDGVIGGKTGYTSQAGETLVTCAKRDGLSLVCVVMKEDSPSQFNDTVTLFDYGFSNFSKVSIADNDSSYNTDDLSSQIGTDLFGSSQPLVSVSPDGYVILPNSADFSDVVSAITFLPETSDSNVTAKINYTYNGTFIGSANVIVSKQAAASCAAAFSGGSCSDPGYKKTIFINMKTVIIIIAVLAALYLLITFICSTIRSYNFAYANINRARHVSRRRHRRNSHDIDF